MIRARFKANGDDYRPVNWPVRHPYWCSGYGEDCSIVIAYADNEEEILENWPEAHDIDAEEVTEYTFTDRFPKPDWFEEPSPTDKHKKEKKMIKKLEELEEKLFDVLDTAMIRHCVKGDPDNLPNNFDPSILVLSDYDLGRMYALAEAYFVMAGQESKYAGIISRIQGYDKV